MVFTLSFHNRTFSVKIVIFLVISVETPLVLVFSVPLEVAKCVAFCFSLEAASPIRLSIASVGSEFLENRFSSKFCIDLMSTTCRILYIDYTGI